MARRAKKTALETEILGEEAANRRLDQHAATISAWAKEKDKGKLTVGKEAVRFDPVMGETIYDIVLTDKR